MILERFGIVKSNDLDNSVWLFEPDLISIHDLLRRWDGLWDEELIEMIRNGKLPAYYKSKYKKDRKRSADGKVMYFCTPVAELDSLIFKGLTFRIDDVELLERQSPELERRLMNSANGQSPVPPGILKRELERLKAVLDGHDERIVEIKKYVEEVNAENAGLREKLEILQVENAKLKSDLGTEHHNSRTALPPPPKNAAACEAVDAKRVEQWKGHATLMVRVAFECATEGPKKRKRPQLVALAKKCGGELPAVALDILRESLPEEHVSREPGPQKQD